MLKSGNAESRPETALGRLVGCVHSGQGVRRGSVAIKGLLTAFLKAVKAASGVNFPQLEVCA